MVIQFNPFAFGLMVVVAVGTIAYTLLKDRTRMHQLYEYPQSRPSPKLSDKKVSKKSKIDENESCAICLEELNCITLPCGHVFHLCCIGQWANGKRNATCPLCRSAI